MVAPTPDQPKTLFLVGATGLVGQCVLQRALSDPRVARIIAPTRRPLAPHPRLDNPIVDFDRLPVDAPWWSVDGAICTLGTTIRQAGSREAFRKVDHDYPLAVARVLRDHGTTTFALNSSMGANPESGNFYLRTKGEVEAAIGACGFPSLTLVRPGLLGGRRAEFRLGERAALIALSVLGPLLPRRYRISHASHVAAALLAAAIAATPGRHVVESAQLA